ncbi:MAG: carbon-nitrogen hydrolase family protein [Saprospiraceae bacterium]|nr:carbon-nitrogen hydrolase family protein [Saprospiraceae bacterium]
MKKLTKIAVVQAGSVLFDKAACIEKVAKMTAEAAEAGAQLVLFPEAFIPAYPRGMSFGTVVGSREDWGRDHWQAYWENAVEMPGEDVENLGAIARESAIYLVIGVVERDTSHGTLYCSILYFAPDGTLLHRHRKLKPTGTERLIWGEGNGADLQVLETPLGRLGGLICWENYMPLARMALYQQNVQLYLAPTADQRDTWQVSMRHIACEGRCFVLSCNQYVQKDSYPLAFQADLANAPEIMSRGGSVIISPLGEVIAGPLWDQEGILYADLDLKACARAKLDFDVVGHYARPDVFDYQWKTQV